MLPKDGVKPFRVFQRTAQRVEAFLRRVTDGLVFCAAYTGLIAFQVILTGVDRDDVGRRGKYPANYRLSKRHLRGDIAVEKFVCHIALIVQIAYICRREAEHRRLRIHREQLLHAAAPHLCAAAVELVEYDIIRTDLF